MKHICLYFQVHHPFNFRIFRFLDVGKSKTYYDDYRNEQEIIEAANSSYLPTNKFMLELIDSSRGKFKVTYHISGTTIDQFLMYSPEVLNSFRQLAETGQVEFTGGTNSHSIASLTDDHAEFKRQILLERERLEYYFGQRPKLFVNTDLIFTKQVAKTVSETGYEALLTNGARKILQWRSPNRLYCDHLHKNVKILFRNDFISNEFAEKFEQGDFQEYRFLSLKTFPPDDPFVNIYLNYKHLGGVDHATKHKHFRSFVSKTINEKTFCFSLPSELTEMFGPVAEIETETPVCWSEYFHPSYFPGNVLQQEAIKQLFKLEKQLLQTKNQELGMDWKYLQMADHFHLMDENHPDYQGSVTKPSIYKSKYDAYINYMNILEDFRQRLKLKKIKNRNEQIHGIQHVRGTNQ